MNLQWDHHTGSEHLCSSLSAGMSWLWPLDMLFTRLWSEGGIMAYRWLQTSVNLRYASRETEQCKWSMLLIHLATGKAKFKNESTLSQRSTPTQISRSACCLITKSCPTLCSLMDCSPPDVPVQGISQARILEWVAISFSRRSSWPSDRTHISCIGKWILCHCAPEKHLVAVKKRHLKADWDWHIYTSYTMYKIDN